MKAQNRIAICPECGTGNETQNKILAHDVSIGFMASEKKREYYICVNCHAHFEHELNWIDGKIVNEETELITLAIIRDPQTDIYWNGKLIEGYRSQEVRDSTSVDCFKDGE